MVIHVAGNKYLMNGTLTMNKRDNSKRFQVVYVNFASQRH
jgi:hypothetical protein